MTIKNCESLDQGVWQGCSVSPKWFNIYRNEIIIHCNQIYSN